MTKHNPLHISAYKPAGFIGEYQKLIKDTVIPYQYSVLCDEAEDTEKSHVIKNFINAAKALKGEDTGDGFYGMVFQDSDVAKWLEAVGYSLAIYPDEKLEKTADEVIDIIAEAQDSDGYLNTYYTIKDKEKRWTNILEGHELYCSGHMIEAAIAYYEGTGKDKLLRVMEKNVEHIYDVFIDGGHMGYPGHPEIELALLKMYDVTKNEKCLKLAKHFVDIRGVDPHYYEKERKSRDWTVWGGDGKNHHYQQSYAPVRQQKNADGHSVRAVYLYTAMADLSAKTDDKELYEACKNLYNSIVNKRMYVTGGIGSTCHGEAFTVDYNLPSDTVYAETCASIGLMFFMSKMLQNEIKSEYTDLMELAFYNAVLAGMQRDGKRFFYVNPLEVIPGITGEAVTHRHALSQRPKWYACACCPPNVARLISSFGKYAFTESSDTVYCHLYAGGKITAENGMKFTCETKYPYDFEVNFAIEKGGKLAVRVPGYTGDNYAVFCNNFPKDTELKDGYIYMEVGDGDNIKIRFQDKINVIYPSAKIPDLSGTAALSRGPLIYCFEGVDNNGRVTNLRLDTQGEFKASPMTDAVLGDTLVIEAQGAKVSDSESLYSFTKPQKETATLRAIPYYLWGNRGENEMRVWIAEN